MLCRSFRGYFVSHVPPPSAIHAPTKVELRR